MDTQRRQAEQRQALKHPIRTRIVELSKVYGDQPLTASTVTEALRDYGEFRHVTLSQVAYHLNCLSDAGLLTVPVNG